MVSAYVTGVEVFFGSVVKRMDFAKLAVKLLIEMVRPFFQSHSHLQAWGHGFPSLAGRAPLIPLGLVHRM